MSVVAGGSNNTDDDDDDGLLSHPIDCGASIASSHASMASLDEFFRPGSGLTDGPTLNRFSNMRPQAAARDIMNNPIYEEEPIHEREEQGGRAANEGGAAGANAEPQPEAPAVAVPAVLPPAAAALAAAASSLPHHERVPPQAQPHALSLDGASAAPAAPVNGTGINSKPSEWAVAEANELPVKSHGAPGGMASPPLHTSTSASGAASSPDGKVHTDGVFTYPSARGFVDERGVAASPALATLSGLGGSVVASSAALRESVPALPVDNTAFDERQASHLKQPVAVAKLQEGEGAEVAAASQAAASHMCDIIASPVVMLAAAGKLPVAVPASQQVVTVAMVAVAAPPAAAPTAADGEAAAAAPAAASGAAAAAEGASTAGPDVAPAATAAAVAPGAAMAEADAEVKAAAPPTAEPAGGGEQQQQQPAPAASNEAAPAAPAVQNSELPTSTAAAAAAPLPAPASAAPQAVAVADAPAAARATAAVAKGGLDRIRSHRVMMAEELTDSDSGELEVDGALAGSDGADGPVSGLRVPSSRKGGSITKAANGKDDVVVAAAHIEKAVDAAEAAGSKAAGKAASKSKSSGCFACFGM